MKKYFLLAALLAVTVQSSADQKRKVAEVPVPGAIMVHNFICEPPHKKSGPMYGTAWELRCETRALAPTHNFQGCTFLSGPVLATTVFTETPLTESSQDASSVIYHGDDHLIVHMNKLTFEATISQNSLISHCKVQHAAIAQKE